MFANLSRTPRLSFAGISWSSHGGTLAAFVMDNLHMTFRSTIKLIIVAIWALSTQQTSVEPSIDERSIYKMVDLSIASFGYFGGDTGDTMGHLSNPKLGAILSAIRSRGWHFAEYPAIPFPTSSPLSRGHSPKNDQKCQDWTLGKIAANPRDYWTPEEVPNLVGYHDCWLCQFCWFHVHANMRTCHPHWQAACLLASLKSKMFLVTSLEILMFSYLNPTQSPYSMGGN